METTEHLLPSDPTRQPESFFDRPEEVLFFDIETTGFSPKTASIYLIGCAFYTKSGWRIRQYFAETPAREGGNRPGICFLCRLLSAAHPFQRANL